MAEGRQILDNIDTGELEKLIPCFKPLTRRYKKGDVILSYSGTDDDESKIHVAILHHGMAHLEVLDINGDTFNLETYHDGDVFGELFTLPLFQNEYTVYADSDCRVVFLDYKHVVTPCEHVCKPHTKIISNLLIMTAQKSQELTFRLSVLSQKNIREKLTVYLKYIRGCSGKKGDEEFEIPISLSDLAAFITVDRSAMTRELAAMKKDGLLDYSHRKFRLMG